MKKLIALFMVVLIAISTTTAAYATEVNGDSNSEIGDSSGMDDGSSGLDDVESGEDNGGEASTEAGSGSDGGSGEDVGENPPDNSEPSEGVSEPSESTPILTLDGATVNVSDESVAAIADAVSYSTYLNKVQKYSNKGTIFHLPELTSEAPYILAITSKEAGTLWVYRSSSPIELVHYSGTKYRVAGYYSVVYDNTGSLGANTSYTAPVISDTYRTDSNAFDYTTVYYYSNHDVADENGNVIYEKIPEDYMVSFETGFEDLTLDSVSSSNFVAPEISYSGYRFDGWYLDADFTLPFTSSYQFRYDVTLYAKWTPYYSVSFVTGIEGYELAPVTVVAGDAYTLPLFSHTGYEFVGAFTDENFETQFVDGSALNGDITLYLKFAPIEYDVGALLTQQVELTKGLQVIQSQLWVVLVVGLLYFVYRLFRIFF